MHKLAYLQYFSGNCTEPDICSCNAGYQLIQGKCTPICEGGCDFGECVAPGQCSCLAGYQKTYGKCEPVCTRYMDIVLSHEIQLQDHFLFQRM